MGKGNQPSRWRLSEDFTSPAAIYKDYEVKINSLNEFWDQIKSIHSMHSDRLLWRGQADHEWGLHSSLFRTLKDEKFGKFTLADLARKDIELKDYFPTEDEMVHAEKQVLRSARSRWRLDSLNAMEIFARIQHRGGPTRLIDFSFNPLIALWFAVSDESFDSVDARLFCLALSGPNEMHEKPNIRLDDNWGSYLPAWHNWNDDDKRKTNHWGTGSLRRFWVPPIYDDRMLAQNSVFVVDGVPISSKDLQSSFRKAQGATNENWKIADLLATGSLYLKFYEPGVKNKSSVRNFASTYSIRVEANKKGELRKQLEDWFGYNEASIYPDVDGLRANLARILNPSR